MSKSRPLIFLAKKTILANFEETEVLLKPGISRNRH